jgi:hypothetical protein
MKGLPPKADNLALLLVQGESLVDAAASLEIPESTARRIAAKPEFRALVARLRTEVLDQGLSKLVGTISAATTAVQELLSADTPPATRLGAARLALEAIVKWNDHLHIAKQVAELKRLEEEDEQADQEGGDQ